MEGARHLSKAVGQLNYGSMLRRAEKENWMCTGGTHKRYTGQLEDYLRMGESFRARRV